LWQLCRVEILTALRPLALRVIKPLAISSTAGPSSQSHKVLWQAMVPILNALETEFLIMGSGLSAS
jgi:hypothetical protein